ncbi:MAG: hypothetical protein WD016_08695 [Balneolaceae bacterium]
MRNNIYLLLFYSLLLFFYGCSTGPDFERGNSKDPSSSNFSPKPPSGANFQMDEVGNVSLFWEDRTDFETGYRVYKTLANSDDFELLAELDKNSVEYIDTSKKIAFPTRYHIVSIFESQESDTLNLEINFGRITQLKAEFDAEYKEVKMTWEGNINFNDGFILSKKTKKESNYKPLKVIPPSVNEYSIPVPQDGFFHEIRVTPFKIFNDDTTTYEPVER